METNNRTKETQIIIVGGGIIGLTLALALAKENINLAIIESKEPVLEWLPILQDPRVSAINLASLRIFEKLGIWNQLKEGSYGPLRRLTVWDHLGGGGISFDSAEAGAPVCGYIVENRALVRELWNNLKLLENVACFYLHQASELWRTHNKVQLILADGQKIQGDLLIGADGTKSWVRDQIGMAINYHDYHQDALITVVKSEYSHQDTAWQNFLTTGPIAYLPLADKHHGAIVWSNERNEINRLTSIEKTSLNFEIANALDQKLGGIEVITEVSTFPLVMRHAKEYISDRVALIGDAAHTIHPLAGQGANLGLLDAACLYDIICKSIASRQDVGNSQNLKQYQRWRKTENLIMENAMTLFNQMFSNSSSLITTLRSQGLNLIDQCGFIKNWIMDYAMGKHYFGKFKLTSNFKDES